MEQVAALNTGFTPSIADEPSRWAAACWPREPHVTKPAARPSRGPRRREVTLAEADGRPHRGGHSRSGPCCRRVAGVASVYVPARRIREADRAGLMAHLTGWSDAEAFARDVSRIQPVIESPRGVVAPPRSPRAVHACARSKWDRRSRWTSAEMRSTYARSECELHARALDLAPLDPFAPHD